MVKRAQDYNGVLLFNKPSGISSHDAVDQIRRITGMRRVGHTGTLDPLAVGLLVICLGRATKISQFLTGCDKVYQAEVHLGVTSETFDSEGVDKSHTPLDTPELSMKQAQSVLDRFKGVIEQTVPAYSAVRVNGTRLYEKARQGEDVQPPIRTVEIKEIKLTDYEKPFLRFEVTCSKGTYIRSLANDIGEQLGCGGHLSGLKRTAVGTLMLADALTIEQVDEFHSGGELEAKLLPYDRVLDYSGIIVNDRFSQLILSGRDLKSADIVRIEGEFNAGEKVTLRQEDGTVLAVGSAEIKSDDMLSTGEESKLFTYVRVLN